MTRSPEYQSKHDKEVLKLANNFKDREFHHVQADITGYPQPSLIDGLRPDVVASTINSEGKLITFIVEVETKDSVNTHRAKSQKTAFQNAANNNEGTRFIERVVS